jgi:ubiquinone/menaquinone biosynthesis C-methylase UbiE
MSGWQLSGDAPSFYIRFSRFIQTPWTDDLIREGRCKEGDRVLDVACGPGTVAERVNQVSGVTCKITGIDINEPMLRAARRLSGIDWHLGSAVDMPFPDASFDVVYCSQGLQYFPDPQAAMNEMARVLVPGGRVAIVVWGALDRQVVHSATVNTVGKYLGAEAQGTFAMAFSLNTREELHTLADRAGFKDVKVRFEQRTTRIPDAAEFIVGFLQANPLASQFNLLADNVKTEFGQYFADLLSAYEDDAGTAAPQENHYLTAIR